MTQQAELGSMSSLLWKLKDVTISPEIPRRGEPVVIRGKVDLFGMSYILPTWVLATIVYPENWWEEIIPIIGAPRVREITIGVGGDFEILFPKGLLREGEYEVNLGAYLGPTNPIDGFILPPVPPVASAALLLSVVGDPPTSEETIRNFAIKSYLKSGGSPVTAPGVLNVDGGDNIRVNLAMEHKGAALTGHKFHVALWKPALLDPHLEVVNPEKSFEIPASVDWKVYENYVDIQVPQGAASYGLYAKIMKGLDDIVRGDYLSEVVRAVGDEVVFILDNPAPTATPATVDPGQTTQIVAKVKSQSSKAQNIQVKLQVFDGGPLWMAGQLLDEQAYPEGTLLPGQTATYSWNYQVVETNESTRDIGVEVWVGGQKVAAQQFDNKIVMMFRCDQCSFIGATREELEEHRQSVHYEPPPDYFQCQVCWAEFPSQAALDAHMALIHPDPRGTFSLVLINPPTWVKWWALVYEEIKKDGTRNQISLGIRERYDYVELPQVILDGRFQFAAADINENWNISPAWTPVYSFVNGRTYGLDLAHGTVSILY